MLSAPHLHTWDVERVEVIDAHGVLPGLQGPPATGRPLPSRAKDLAKNCIVSNSFLLLLVRHLLLEAMHVLLIACYQLKNLYSILYDILL